MSEIAFGVCISVLSTASLVLRFASRRVHQDKLWYDDWTVALGWLFSFGPAINLIIFAEMQSRLMSANINHEFIPQSASTQDRFFVMSYVFFAMYGLSISFTKWAILIFYWRMFNALPWMRKSIIVISSTIAAWTLAAIVTWLVQCHPIQKSWHPATPGVCINFYVFAISISIINIVTDFIILVLPVPVVLGLKTTIGKKISLLIAFGFGSLVCAIAAIRFSLLVKAGSSPNYSSGTVLAWTTAEVSTAVICANLPFAYSLIIHYLPASVKKVFRHGYSSRTRTTDHERPDRSYEGRYPRGATPLSVFRSDSVSEDQCQILSPAPSLRGVHEENKIYITKDFMIRRQDSVGQHHG